MMGSVIPWTGGTGFYKKSSLSNPGGGEQDSKKHPSVPLHQFLPSGSCPVSFPILTFFNDGL